MFHCGSLDDVYAYEKMRRPTKQVSRPLSPINNIIAKPALHKKTMSFSTSAPDQSPPPSAQLGAKKSLSFRWISRHSSGTPANSERRVSTEKASSSTPPAPALLPPKKPKDPPTKRIGFVDILLGYHSLLQASPAFPTAAHRREIHPTIGFIRNPDYGTQS